MKVLLKAKTQYFLGMKHTINVVPQYFAGSDRQCVSAADVVGHSATGSTELSIFDTEYIQ